MTPYKIFDLQPGDSALFGPEYGDLATMTKLAGNVGISRSRRFTVEVAPGGSLVTRLPDQDKNEARAERAAQAHAERAPRATTLTERLLAVEPGTSQFFLAREFNPESLRTTASAINRAGQHRLQVVIETRPVFGARVTSLDLAAGVTDATGKRIDFAAGERMRKYPFATMVQGDSFTVPAGTTDITTLRASAQRYRRRYPCFQYKVTRNEDGGFTVTCSLRGAGF